MEPDEYERDHVHQVYEQIATHFSSTRYKVPSRVRRSPF
jgi:tRNA (uracil-5-)-methyltransferase TRM9